MCHNVHMKTISIRELHLKTGRWVRHAASRGTVVVTDRGRRVAALQPFDASVAGRPLPNREAAIRKQSKVPVDSAVYVSELGADRVREVAYGAEGLASCELARLEFASILKRHVRERHVTRREMTAILKDFDDDEKNGVWQWFRVTSELLEKARTAVL